VDLEILPATPDRWDDIEQLFGPTGQQGGCWCMWNRQTSREFAEHKGDENKASFRALVEADRPPGLLAYADGIPVGWVAVAPRYEYGRLQRSRVTKPVDDVAVWAITCFVVARRARGTGVATALLGAAVEFARSQGARAVEGYPVEPRSDHMPEIYAWMGLASMFENSGFKEIARRSETRPVMRRIL
jgi:GNAT superfamily N-acetyltransferase